MKIQGRSLKKTYLGMFFAVILILGSLLFLDILANAENIRIGTVSNEITTTLNFRSSAGNGSVIASLRAGDKGTILGETKVDGVTWYQMNVNGVVGWATSRYINVTSVSVSSDFETYLTQQGFPESYKVELRNLHALYPNWKFEAQHTNLTWNEMIQAQSVLGTSLVGKNSISSWKSIQNGAYYWDTGTWKTFDGGSWVAASEELISYYVDPRNFLDSQYIFQFLKQSYDSNMNYSPSLTSMFSKSRFWSSSFVEEGKTKNYVSAVIDAGAQSGVSPYTIASTILVEQGWEPTSASVSGASGHFNFFNIGAYEADGMQPTERGIWYAKQTDSSTLRPWNTRTKSLAGGAKVYGKNYIGVGQDTIYLKKFDVIPYGGLYNHQYMTNIQAAASEGKVLSDAFWSPSASESTRTSSLIFKIPVYKNMPTSACPKPTGTGSPNYMLKSLSIAGQNLTPTFNMYETSYSLIVPHDVSSVNVSASAYDSNAKIAGTGVIQLQAGQTTKVDIKVTAPNGNVRTYTISIVCQPAPSTPSNVPTVSSGSYTINSSSKLVTGVKPSTKAADFIKGLTVSNNGEAKLVKPDGSAQTNMVGTGNKIQIYDNAKQLKATYEVVIYGDADGDGTVYTLDYIRIKKSILGTLQLSGSYKMAADASKNGQVDTLDYIQVKKQILGQYTIQQ